MLFKDLARSFARHHRRDLSRTSEGRAPGGIAGPSMPLSQGREGESRTAAWGRSWSFDSSGVRAEGFLWRTAGAPVTCRLILDTLGDEILAMARARRGARFDHDDHRYRGERIAHDRFHRSAELPVEGHVRNRDIVPEFRGSYSAGPMQILATTARDLIASGRTAYVLDYDRFAVAPAYRERPAAAPATHPLYLAAVNLDLGTAYIRRNLHLTGGDPILVAAAYNSGGLYQSTANPWHLRSHGDHLIAPHDGTATPARCCASVACPNPGTLARGGERHRGRRLRSSRPARRNRGRHAECRPMVRRAPSTGCSVDNWERSPARRPAPSVGRQRSGRAAGRPG